MPGRPLVALAVVALAVTACSNSTTVAAKRPERGTATASPGASGVQVVTITTGNDLRFHPATIVVHPGKVRIVLRNTAQVGSGPPHNLYLPVLGNGVPYANAGQTQQYTFTAPAPGRYQFVCQLHAAQGQTGTLVVEG